MPISTGDRLPDCVFYTTQDLQTLKTTSDVREYRVKDIFSKKRVVLLLEQGAFTPVCSTQHMPQFIENYDKLRQQCRADLVACVSANDPFVMSQWSKSLGTNDRILMLGDPMGEFIKATDLMIDMRSKGLGYRFKRGVLLVEDGVVKFISIDDGPVKNTTIDKLLSAVSQGTVV